MHVVVKAIMCVLRLLVKEPPAYYSFLKYSVETDETAEFEMFKMLTLRL